MKSFKKALLVLLICIVFFGCAKKNNNNNGQVETKKEVLNDKGQYVYNGKYLDTLKSIFNCSFATSYTKEELLNNDSKYIPFNEDKSSILDNPSSQGIYYNSGECDLVSKDSEIDLYNEIHALKYNLNTASELKSDNFVNKIKSLGFKVNESYDYSVVLNDLFNSDSRLEHLKYQFNESKKADYLMVTYNTFNYGLKEGDSFEIAGIKTNMTMDEVIKKYGKPNEVIITVSTVGTEGNKLNEATIITFIYNVKKDKNLYSNYETNLKINWSNYVLNSENKASYTDFSISSINASVVK